jgi:hypothetical protein
MTAVAMKAVAGTKPSFEPEKPPPLFEAHLTQSATFFQSDVTANGERFLLATTAGTAYPPLLNVVINWKWDWRDDWANSSRTIASPPSWALVMELIESQTLPDRIAEGQLPLAKPLELQSTLLMRSRQRAEKDSSIVI